VLDTVNMRSLVVLFCAAALVCAFGTGWLAGRSGFIPSSAGHLLDPYFMDPTSLGEMPTDDAGVPMTEYATGLEYNPTLIAGQAIGYYNDWLRTSSPHSRARFLDLCDWLVAHQLKDGRWVYKFSYGDQPTPWWSALAQSHGLNALARAFGATGNAKYKAAAKRALLPFHRPLEEAGVTMIDEGHVWYEEYLPPRAPHTLNGFMFALIDLWDYQKEFGDADSRQLWRDGIQTLTHFIDRFDTGAWSCYSMTYPPGTPRLSVTHPVAYPAPSGCKLATASYHQIHVWQLRELHSITHNPILGAYADRWQAFLPTSSRAP